MPRKVLQTLCWRKSLGRVLGLKPWQIPPVWIRDLDASLAQPSDDHRGERDAAELLTRLLDAGLSRFEPNPLRALDRIARTRTA